MRRTLNWFVVFLSAAFLFGATLLSGCSGGGAGRAVSDEPPVAADGLLRPVRDAAELEAVLKRNLEQTVAEGVPDGSAAMPNASTDDFTYVLEPGVDELDFVRYDGDYLFIAPTAISKYDGGSIRILRTDPATATATEVGSIAIATEDMARIVMGMYLADGRLVLVTTEAYYGPYGDAWAACMVWAPTQFTVEVHDVSDPAHPRKLSSAVIDGVYVESRRMGDRVVMVSRQAPRVLLDPLKRALLSRLTLAEMLPAMVLNGRSTPLVEPERCYLNNDGVKDDTGYSVLTNITTFSMSDPDAIENVCYNQAADGVYASKNALYISEPRYHTDNSTSTRIHKFSLGGAHTEYAGSAEIAGAIWGPSQRDFRMNESGGDLRVMTTENTTDLDDLIDHRLFVLRPKAGAHALEIIGRLPNESRPAEIGKPSESLYSVRFAANRAYASTFRRIDPLYVFDLSSPADPRIGGELEIPGSLDFLHPVSDGLLLSLGSESNRLKLELFDTSVLEHPQSRGVISLGGTYSSTPAIHDRHAFTYLADEDGDRFAIPAWIYTEQPELSQSSMTFGLHQFEVLGKEAPPSASLQQAGVVTPPGSEIGASVSRSYIDGDAVYFVRDGQVWGTSWSMPSQVNGPF